MNHDEMVQHIVTTASCTTTQASAALQAALSGVAHALTSGAGTVRLNGIGTLKVIDTKPRTGRNPRTGQTINIPGGRKVKFTLSKTLKEAIAKPAAA